MKRIFSLCSLFLLSSVCSQQILLDEMMSLEDQKSTGVAYLTPKQKIALEDWINIHCNCPSKPQEKEKQNLYMSINIDNGREIQLNDNSIWEVDPRDYVYSEAWLTSFPIKIVPSDDPDFPFLLVNKSTGVSVRVRKGVAPPPTPIQAAPPTTPNTPPLPPPVPAPTPRPVPKTPPPKPAPSPAPGAVPMPPAPNPMVTPFSPETQNSAPNPKSRPQTP
jgi:hypothetical protein